MGSSTTAAKGTFKWIDELAKRPQNSRFRFVNFGVGGDLSVNIAKRLDPVLRVAPDRVIVLIGTNDILATVFPNFRRFTRAWKQISEEPSPAHFKDNLELVTRPAAAGNLRHDRTEFAVARRRSRAIDDTVQARLNELVAAYNRIVGDVSHSSGAYYIPLYERFRDQLDRSVGAKPFTRFSFAAFYRDYLFREMILRRSFDEISQRNGWEFHIDGIHLNTRDGRILTDVVQQFLYSPSKEAASGLGSRL
jgi:lysophospholipase L1-like esterase